MNLQAIISLIDLRALTLPRFQRGYVWKRPDVIKLMRSLYKGYPVGSLLIWETQATQVDVRGDEPIAPGTHKLLLDGQQRVTSLYGIIKDELPNFSDGNEHSFRNLYFNVVTEEFEFYGPVKMKDDPRWISVTDLMQRGIGPFFSRFAVHPDNEMYVNRLLSIVSIKERIFHVETVSGTDKNMETVVEIFNQVNSGGTKLSKGDLALAKICADWPQAREEMQTRLKKWAENGYYNFNLDWLLRCINALLTGHADFAELDRQQVSVEQIKDGLARAEKHIDSALNLLASRLGLDHDYVLGSPNSLIAMTRFFDQYGAFHDQGTLDRLCYWYIHAMLWQRYSGPTETRIRQDVMAIEKSEDPVERLIERLRENRWPLRVEPQDFAASRRGGRFYSMLYMLTRTYGARDLCKGIELRKFLLGGGNQLELHHIFPKSQLIKFGGYDQKEVNAHANFTFLTKDCNLQISTTLPEHYFPQCEDRHPGVLDSHWIPMDPDLWKIENYRDFLAERRKRLAAAANNLFDKLRLGAAKHESQSAPLPSERPQSTRPVSIASDSEESELLKAMNWMESKNLPRGEYGFELVSADGDLLATLDLAWPRGIQEGYSRQAALLIDESEETRNVAEDCDYKCFTSLFDLQRHVQREILGEPTPM